MKWLKYFLKNIFKEDDYWDGFASLSIHGEIISIWLMI